LDYWRLGKGFLKAKTIMSINEFFISKKHLPKWPFLICLFVLIQIFIFLSFIILGRIDLHIASTEKSKMMDDFGSFERLRDGIPGQPGL
jgi:hypothetical protein